MNTREFETYIILTHGSVAEAFYYYRSKDFEFSSNGERQAFENLICDDRNLASDYAFITHRPFKMAENLFMDNPYYAYYYAVDSIGGRWKDGEPTIVLNIHSGMPKRY